MSIGVILSESYGLDAAPDSMKSTLIYNRPLCTSGNSSRKNQDKWEIRRTLHPQIRDFLPDSPKVSVHG